LWGTEISPLYIMYEKIKTIKWQILPDFTTEWLELQNIGQPDLSSVRTMYFDGSKRVEGAGAGVVLISPQGDKLKYDMRMSFQTMKPYTRPCCMAWGWPKLVVQLASESLVILIWLYIK
jgi:hypothetical protein